MFFFLNNTATTEIYTLSLHDALPISRPGHHAGAAHRLQPPIRRAARRRRQPGAGALLPARPSREDRKSTRLNSSHANISYAVFCLKKKKQFNTQSLTIMSSV